MKNRNSKWMGTLLRDIFYMTVVVVVAMSLISKAQGGRMFSMSSLLARNELALSRCRIGTEEDGRCGQLAEPDAPHFVAVLVAWHTYRWKNLESTIYELLSYPWIREVVVWNNNLDANITMEHLVPWLDGRRHTLPVRIIQSKVNTITRARYQACLTSAVRNCLVIDDDWYPIGLRALRASYILSGSHGVHVLTNPGTRHFDRSKRLTVEDTGTRFGFAWVGVSAMFSQSLARRFLQVWDEVLAAEPDAAVLRGFEDFLFTSFYHRDFPITLETAVTEYPAEDHSMALSSASPYSRFEYQAFKRAVVLTLRYREKWSAYFASLPPPAPVDQMRHASHPIAPYFAVFSRDRPEPRAINASKHWTVGLDVERPNHDFDRGSKLGLLDGDPSTCWSDGSWRELGDTVGLQFAWPVPLVALEVRLPPWALLIDLLMYNCLQVCFLRANSLTNSPELLSPYCVPVSQTNSRLYMLQDLDLYALRIRVPPTDTPVLYTAVLLRYSGEDEKLCRLVMNGIETNHLCDLVPLLRFPHTVAETIDAAAAVNRATDREVLTNYHLLPADARGGNASYSWRDGAPFPPVSSQHRNASLLEPPKLLMQLSKVSPSLRVEKGSGYSDDPGVETLGANKEGEGEGEQGKAAEMGDDVGLAIPKDHRTLVIGVWTSYDAFEFRNAARNTWMRYGRCHPDVELLFVVESRSPPTAVVEKEAQHYGDMIRIEHDLDFYRWALAKYDVDMIMRTKDDTYVNVQRLMKDITLTKGLRRKLYYGHFFTAQEVYRDPLHPNYEPLIGPEFTTYPPYASGSGYVLGVDVLRDAVLDPAEPFLHLRNMDAAVGLAVQRLTLEQASLHHTDLAYPWPPYAVGRDFVLIHGLCPAQFDRIYALFETFQNTEEVIFDNSVCSSFFSKHSTN